MKFNLPFVIAMVLGSTVLPSMAQDLDYAGQPSPWATSTGNQTTVNEQPNQSNVRIKASLSIQGCNAGLLLLPSGYKCKSLALVSEGGLVPDPVYYGGGGGGRGGGTPSGCGGGCTGSVTSGDGSSVSSGDGSSVSSQGGGGD